MITLPQAGRGRRSVEQARAYQRDLEQFAASLLELQSRLDFAVSSRGWCYILEEHGLQKGDFDKAETLINDCRKNGLLPIDICAEDGARGYEHVEDLDDDDADEHLKDVINVLDWQVNDYTPVSFWEDKNVYLQMWVEKIDLKSLFSPLCQQYYVPLANCRGWSDLNMRFRLMERFKVHEEAGRQGVLLYCGDHDPVGLVISQTIRNNLAELSQAVGWRPTRLEIHRFGLNADFIEAQGLSWIDNLETGSGRDLADLKHPDYRKPHVQNYLRQYGARKVEANALVVRPNAGRELCRQAILKYLDSDSPERYKTQLEPYRADLRLRFDSYVVGTAKAIQAEQKAAKGDQP